MSGKDKRKLNKCPAPDIPLSGADMYSSAEILSFLAKNGRIDISGVAEEMRNKEREEVLNSHKYAISQEKSGKWISWIPDTRCASGRRLLRRNTRKLLEDAIYEFYAGEDPNKIYSGITLEKLYPKWLEYKKLHTKASTYIIRVESEWKRYYKGTEIVRRKIADLTKLDLDMWVHNMIKSYDMTKTMYYNMSMIMRQCLDYAVDRGIISENPLSKVEIDGRRMFRHPKKQKDETQVYLGDEEALLLKTVWESYKTSTKLVYRLAPLAIIFQFLTGLRVGELCAVRFKDVKGSHITIQRMLRRDSNEIVDHTKTHTDRDVILPSAAMQIIEECRRYQEEHGGAMEYIFSMTKEPLVHDEVNLLLRRYCKRIGIDYRSSHKIRKTYISKLIDANMNINTIREMVGHADERTTYHNYCFDRSSDAERQQVMDKALSL